MSGHFRSSGTHVAPYYRTPANGIPYDNLSYRGYPSQQPGYVSPRSYDYDSTLSRPSTLPALKTYDFEKSLRTLDTDCLTKPARRQSGGFGF